MFDGGIEPTHPLLAGHAEQDDALSIKDNRQIRGRHGSMARLSRGRYSTVHSITGTRRSRCPRRLFRLLVFAFSQRLTLKTSISMNRST